MSKTMPFMQQFVFRLKTGADIEAFQASAAAVQTWMRNQQGFLGRTLAFNEAVGEWIDTARWSDAESAQTAGEAFMAADVCKHFMTMVDNDSVRMATAREVPLV